MIEYLTISLTIILAIIAMTGPIQAMAYRLEDRVEHELSPGHSDTIDRYLKGWNWPSR